MLSQGSKHDDRSKGQHGTSHTAGIYRQHGTSHTAGIRICDGQIRASQGLYTAVLHSGWKLPTHPQNTFAVVGNLKYRSGSIDSRCPSEIPPINPVRPIKSVCVRVWEPGGVIFDRFFSRWRPPVTSKILSAFDEEYSDEQNALKILVVSGGHMFFF